MFTNLKDFSKHRTLKEAVGFYLAYLILGMLVGALSALVFAPQGNSDAETIQNATRVGMVIAPLYSAAITILVVVKREQKSAVGFLAIGLSLVLGYLGGAMLGLLPASYLTTKE